MKGNKRDRETERGPRVGGGSRNLKGVRGGLSGRANPKRAIPLTSGRQSGHLPSKNT